MEAELRKEIKKFLKRKDIKVNRLAKLAGVEPVSLYRFLNNKDCSITLRTAEKLQEAIRHG